MGVSIGDSDKGQDVEINIASIIDCLTVLIAYTLISASFITVGLLDANVLPPGASPSPGRTPEAHVRVGLRSKRTIEVGIRNPAGEIVEVSEIMPTLSGDYDLETLQAKIELLRGKYAALTQIDLGAETEVPYKDVVKAIERSRKVLPTIVLGDF
jgi:biopolymer transport protein ExbD